MLQDTVNGSVEVHRGNDTVRDVIPMKRAYLSPEVWPSLGAFREIDR